MPPSKDGKYPAAAIERGRQQAQDLAVRLTHAGIDAICSSPLERAVETARPLAQLLRLELAIGPSLIEIDFGDWTNRSFAELGDDPAFRRFNAFRSTARIPGGEYMQQAQERIITGLDEL